MKMTPAVALRLKAHEIAVNTMTITTFLDLLYKRRSIRKYKTQDIEQSKIDALTQAALLAPSSRGRHPWEIIIVDQPDILSKLSKSKRHSSELLAGAPLAFVIAGNPKITDVWVEDTAIVATLIQLEAEHLGLSSCWVHIRNRPHNRNLSADTYVKNILSIPDPLSVDSIIAVGYPDELKEAYSEKDLLWDKVHINSYIPKNKDLVRD